jgi:alkylation response protein AidB-like acyl-CoA dehydrogenase
MQAMGAVGLFPQNGYDRLLTSARIVANVDGTTEMQNERIGAVLLKRYGRGGGSYSPHKKPRT